MSMKLKIAIECTVDESGNISGLKFQGKSTLKGPTLRSSIMSREHWSEVRHLIESSFNMEEFKNRKVNL
jgi:hypothetical protein